MKYYVFDFDNTLVFTDVLNNEAYNFVLKKFGLSEIRDVARLTRKIVFQRYPEVEKWKDEIIELKQKFFLKHLERTLPSREFLQLVISGEGENILWTSAEEIRVFAVLKYYKITEKFKKVVFSKKTDVEKDVKEICRIFKCNKEELIFFEDNLKVIQELERLKLSYNMPI